MDAKRVDGERVEVRFSEGSADGKVKRVLIADDEEALRDLLTAFLTRLGYRTKAVENGRQALEEVRAGGIDLVISDYSMPVLNGLQLYDHMLEESPGLAGRFILITGTSFTSEVLKFVETHEPYFLEKPFRLPDLAAMVEDALKSPMGEPASVN